MAASTTRHCFQWTDVGGITVVHFTVRSIRADEDITNIFDGLNRMVDEGRTHLVLDFSNVQQLASFTIGKLLALHKKVQKQKGRLVLCQLTPVVSEILSIMRLDRIFEIHGTEEKALQSF